MFAVFTSGGKQYRASVDDVVKLEKLAGEPGSQLVIDKVLMVGSGTKDLMVGTPYIKNAEIIAEIVNQKRDKKIVVFKKERRQHYQRKQGHKQYVTQVRIKEIKIA